MLRIIADSTCDISKEDARKMGIQIVPISVRFGNEEFLDGVEITHEEFYTRLAGGKWKLRILWHIMNGDNRFSMLEKTIDSITPKVLMSQLNEMEESGLILKHVLVSTPPKVVVYEINPEYSGICEIVNIAHSFSRMYGTKNNIDILTKK